MCSSSTLVGTRNVSGELVVASLPVNQLRRDLRVLRQSPHHRTQDTIGAAAPIVFDVSGLPRHPFHISTICFQTVQHGVDAHGQSCWKHNLVPCAQS